MSRPRFRSTIVAAATAGVLSSLLGIGAPPAGGDVATPPYPQLLPLHATRGEGAGLFDSTGRRVQLRGINDNKLGDYAQANDDYPVVLPEHPDDFPEMARLGFSVVRLLISWSSVEPEPGVYDDAYLDRVAAAVDDAEANGLYVVIDMHQDAWGKYIASPADVVCPEGTEPAIGWDGAPEWATIFDPGPDGANTCRSGSRETSPAVQESWDNFYANTDNIQTHLVSTWRVIGNRFGTDPAVAGFDLLNEPGEGSAARSAGNVVALGTYYAAAIDAIRAGESDAATATATTVHHPIFFEPSVIGSPVPYDFSADTNLVFAPHNYGESITGPPTTVESVFGYFDYQAHQYGTPFWIGEYGFFSVTPEHVDALTRYGHLEDTLSSTLLVGSSWWQFEQACGDPHSVNTPGGTPASELIHLKRSTCPGDEQSAPIPEWTTVISRPYPRLSPGTITTLVANGAARTMRLDGIVAPGGGPGSQFVLWVPGATSPAITGTGIAAVTTTAVTGGWIVSGTACGTYTVAVDTAGAGAAAPATCAAIPVVTPAFTG